MSCIWDIIFDSCKSHSSHRPETMGLRVGIHTKHDPGYTSVPSLALKKKILPGAGSHRTWGNQTTHSTGYNTMQQEKD